MQKYKVSHIDYDGSRIVSYELGQPLCGMSHKGATDACKRLAERAMRNGQTTQFIVLAH